MSKKVLVVIADGTEEIEATTIIDVLRRAQVGVVVASTGQLQIKASRGVNIVADKLIADCLDVSFDAIILPGGMPGAEHFRDCRQLIDMLKAQKSAGRIYAAICASPAVVFAHHKLIDDKIATCYPGMTDKLPNPDDSGSDVVVDGNCITSRGPATAMAFALKLVEFLCDKAKADEVAKALLV